MDRQAVRLIREAGEITAEWMRAALTAGGALAGGAAAAAEVAGVEVEQLSEVRNALGNLYRCRLTAGDGGAAEPGSVIVKLPGTDALALRFARWMSLHRREYVFYRDMAGKGHVRTPALFYGGFDERSHDFVLVLEDLGGMEAVPQSAGMDAARARAAVGAAAALHGRFWEANDDPALAKCGAFLTTRESRIMQTVYLLTLPAALERFGDLFSARTRRLAEAFGFGICAHFATVSAGPKTVVHGDFRADNMLFGDAEPPAVIDWQGCGMGCGMYDVAFLLATSVTSEVRRGVEREALEEYHAAVVGAGARGYSREACWHSYRQNMLGTLMPMVIGCGALEMSDPKLVRQTRELLGRTLTAIEELDSWAFVPRRARFGRAGWGFERLSRCGYGAYRVALRMRRVRG
ncbi:MAG: phosphotransferase [Caldilineaceae bacterium]|nr:phosphotransferase [Caldilineaceae bacterium]MDE0338817.1 phosphotransferase [Caldilineaceae bacterium]